MGNYSQAESEIKETIEIDKINLGEDDAEYA